MFLKTTFLEGEKRHRLLFSKYPPTTHITVLQACHFRKERRVSKNAQSRIGSLIRMVRLGEGLQMVDYNNMDLAHRHIA